MLQYIEAFNGTTWKELELELTEPKSHTCATSLNFQGKDFVFVIGGWNQDLEYVSTVEVFQVESDGDLALNMTTELPADRTTDPDRTKGKSDLGCLSYR